jgi:uncharacterized protein (DUF1499 family)
MTELDRTNEYTRHLDQPGGSDTPPSSRAARIASWFGKFSPSCVLAGLLGIHIGVIPPLGGFLIFQLGLLAALFAIGFGIAGVIATRSDTEGLERSKAWLGLASGSVMFTLTIGLAGAGLGSPPINDITTDLEDPPRFASPADVPDFEGRDRSYPSDFVEVVRTSYADLGPTRLPIDQKAAFDLGVRTAESLGWEIVHRDAAAGTFDARETTRVFKFVDDITVRVRADGSDSIIDVRSKSRDGRGDLGANAKRIRSYQSALGEAQR